LPALVVFGQVFGVSSNDVSVASTFLLAIVGFMILVNISAPMNKYHFAVIAGCIIGIMVTAYLFSDLFAITYVSKECIMLFLIFAIAVEPIMRYLTKLFRLLERKLLPD
jgi:cation-transporting ATPase E